MSNVTTKDDTGYPRGLAKGQGVIAVKSKKRKIRIIAEVKSDGYKVQYRNAKGKAAWMFVPFLPGSPEAVKLEAKGCGS